MNTADITSKKAYAAPSLVLVIVQDFRRRRERGHRRRANGVPHPASGESGPTQAGTTQGFSFRALLSCGEEGAALDVILPVR